MFATSLILEDKKSELPNILAESLKFLKISSFRETSL